MAELAPRRVDEHRHARAVALGSRGVGVDVELLERHAKGAQRARHLLAQMAADAPVEPERGLSPYR